VTTLEAPTPAPAAGGRGARSDKGPGRIERIRIYLREVVAELRKVIRPSRQQLVTYTIVVLVFVSFMTALVSGLDYGLTKAVLAIFG
jgi:preprotein translocase subunit SecE